MSHGGGKRKRWKITQRRRDAEVSRRREKQKERQKRRKKLNTEFTEDSESTERRLELDCGESS
jgi:hypothetical protein